MATQKSEHFGVFSWGRHRHRLMLLGFVFTSLLRFSIFKMEIKILISPGKDFEATDNQSWSPRQSVGMNKVIRFSMSFSCWFQNRFPERDWTECYPPDWWQRAGRHCTRQCTLMSCFPWSLATDFSREQPHFIQTIIYLINYALSPRDTPLPWEATRFKTTILIFSLIFNNRLQCSKLGVPSSQFLYSMPCPQVNQYK